MEIIPCARIIGNDMQRQRVKSSVIAAVAHDPHSKVLEVEFHTGRIYNYFDVPAGVYETMLASDSMGKFFNEEIRPNYRSSEVRWTELDRYPDLPDRRR